MSLPLGTGERVFAHFILDIWGPERPTRGWKRGPSLPGWDLRLGLRTRPPKFQLTLPRVTVTPARTTLCPRGSGGQDVCLMSRVSRGLEQRLVHGLGSSSAPERRIRNDTSAWSEALGAWRTQDLPERSPLAERGRGSLAPTSQTRKPRLRHGRPFARRRTAGQSLDVFFGAGCVFTRCQPASPNSTVTSLWAQVSAVDLLSVDGGLVSQKPGARARAGAPFSGVDHLCIGSGMILSGALFPFPVSRDRACVSVLVLFPERRLAFRRRAGCNRTRVGFEKRPDLSNPHPHRVSPSPRDSQPPSARPARDSAASLGVPWPPCHVSREWRGVASRLSRRTFALLQGTTLVTEK
ncbi:uncharacterized protein LOC123578990 isoform X1 [Leopardus geoffroyi]|uniref:uncharacterized protein LOC123578990 isoform X1 n=1 Tax=Leopardus geoffroyi TaxID=46844 RepID=UPI001E25D53D|nr:uncharacterized protein LOC123578990 isoform X1 [Leopardus geoffroyi]